MSSTLHPNPLIHNLLSKAKNRTQTTTRISLLKKARLLDPSSFYVNYQLALAYYSANQFTSALAYLNRTLLIHPGFAPAHNTLGVIYYHRHRLKQAQQAFLQATQLDPNFAIAFNNLANTYKNLGNFQKALSTYQHCLKLSPYLPEAHFNLGMVYQKMGNMELANSHFTQALGGDATDHAVSDKHDTHQILTSDTDQILTMLESSLKKSPQNTLASASLIHLLKHTCDWDKLNRIQRRMLRLSQSQSPQSINFKEPPFNNITRTDDLADNLSVASFWSHDLQVRTQKLLPSFHYHPPSPTPLRLGYLSFDYHNHATAHLITQLFHLHHRHRFTVYAYSYGPNHQTSERRLIQDSVDVFRDIRDQSFVDSARLIHRDRIDILIDLKGYTQGTRLEITSLKPAPIQISWLGFPGTLGAKFIDYVIADPLVTPFSHQQYYTEKLLLLPHSYQVTDSHQKISPQTFHRSDFGLDPTDFVYASFNHSYKFDPHTFALWISLLKDHPDSVLWLLEPIPSAQNNLRRFAQRHNVNPQRLIFSSNLPKDLHLARLRLADLCLDTKLVNGHTTTTDSLWAGIPVIALFGRHFASRVSASILASLGLSQLITHSLDDYYHLALYLASHPQKVAVLKSKIINHKSITLYPHFNTERFTTNLETAYLTIWDNHLQGHSPQPFTITDPLPINQHFPNNKEI